jgi:hypothetical protein
MFNIQCLFLLFLLFGFVPLLFSFYVLFCLVLVSFVVFSSKILDSKFNIFLCRICDMTYNIYHCHLWKILTLNFS